MFCGNCGKKNEDGSKFCFSCGLLVEGAAPAESTSGVLDLGGIIKFEAPSEDNAKLVVAGKAFEAGMIFKVMAVVGLVLLFFPFLGVRVMGISESSSGFAFAFQTDGFNFFALFLFLIPVALFCLHLAPLKEHLKFTKGYAFIISAALSVFAVIVPFLVRMPLARDMRLANQATGLLGAFGLGNIDMSLRIQAGFILLMILYVLAAAVSVGFIMAAKNK